MKFYRRNKTDITEYLSIDHTRLDNYLSQLKNDRSFFKKWGISFGGNLGPLRIQTTDPEKIRDINVHQKIIELTKLLGNSESLLFERPYYPKYHHILENVFILEKHIKARRLLLQKTGAVIKGLLSIVIWVSMPRNIKPGKRDDIYNETEGSVLYLIESFWEDDRYSSMITGCSALQWVIKNAIGDDPSHFDLSNSKEFDTPFDAFESLGAIDQGERTISTLYRIRYLTDESFFKHHGKKFRCFDVIGYPVYISSP